MKDNELVFVSEFTPEQTSEKHDIKLIIIYYLLLAVAGGTATHLSLTIRGWVQFIILELQSLF